MVDTLQLDKSPKRASGQRTASRFPPWQFVRDIYHETSWYQRKRQAKRAVKVARRRQRDAEIVANVFENDLTVRSGLFQGMRYIDSACGSHLLPKLLGSYEEQLFDWIRAFDGRYRTVINVGCAEGYFAVGLVFAGLTDHVLAYDINPRALELASRLAALNGLQDAVEFHSKCDHDELSNQIRPDTLIFCDIEGHELTLLDPEKCPALRTCDIVFEAHDVLISDLTDTITQRFSDTHEISVVYDTDRASSRYPVLAGWPESIAEVVLDEERPIGMSWVRMLSRQDISS